MAFSNADAASELRRLESAGALEPRATRAVLVAAGHGDQVTRTQQGVHAGAIALDQFGCLADGERHGGRSWLPT